MEGRADTNCQGIPLLPSQQHTRRARGLKEKSGDEEKSPNQAHPRTGLGGWVPHVWVVRKEGVDS